MTAEQPGSGPAPSAAPAGQPAPPVPGSFPLRWAWMAVAACAAWTALAALVAYIAGPGWSAGASVRGGLVASDVVACGLAIADARAIRQAGGRAGSGWLALLFSPPAYLLVRAIQLRGRRGAWGIFAAGLAAWAVAGVLAYPAARTVAEHTARLDSAVVQQQIQDGVQRQAHISVTVSCPHDPPATPGTSFQCVITAADGSARVVDVTVQPDGSIVWQVRQ